MKLSGTVHKYGVNVDTDAIIPARYLNVSEGAELAKHAMEGIDVQFVNRVSAGDFIVAGANFGCGSSREHAPLAIKASGVACVVAGSFARIFFRNAINIGLPILTCEEVVAGTESGDTLEIDLETGRIRNVTRGTVYRAQPYPQFMLELIAAGGLIEHTRARLKARGVIP
ncbi:MAG: 3-isopropylmalate dehydratase small subunit [Chloroflexi bacterium]|nr:3-isopropylmalate dehydratase small subunit [Chloroflexota bacterium]